MASTIPNGKHAAVNAKLTDTTFTDCCLGGARFDDVNLAAAAFRNVNLTGARFDDVNLSGAAVTNANVDGMTIDGVPVSELLAAYRRTR
ncbi:MAG TPA: pentapeptide repeat-containing protein [Tepidisphaeraceae bacterium]|nr:pentapeptide repeat-containing protein [Tepidisphaeraceae bacterium]